MVEDFVPPTVSLDLPAAGSTISGMVKLAAAAFDDVQVKCVSFHVNGVIVGTAHDQPYHIMWDSHEFPNGPASISAYSVDTSGNQSLPSTHAVVIQNVGEKAVHKAKVSFIEPQDGEKLFGVTVIKGMTSGATGITALHLAIDGKKVRSLGSVNLIKYEWDTDKVASGKHEIAVIAEDAAGNSSTAKITVIKP